jgi:heat shock protein HspQ
MGTVTKITRAKFSIGELIHHRLFDYRGVIIDVDRKCKAPDEWYEQVAKSRPPKNEPWYHVLVHENMHSTYVAEQNLEHDDSLEPIIHPLLRQFFSKLENGKYIRKESGN